MSTIPPWFSRCVPGFGATFRAEKEVSRNFSADFLPGKADILGRPNHANADVLANTRK